MNSFYLTEEDLNLEIFFDIISGYDVMSTWIAQWTTRMNAKRHTKAMSNYTQKAQPWLSSNDTKNNSRIRPVSV